MNCTFEREVIQAVKSSQWTDNLRIHAADCPACQETIIMTTIMNNAATSASDHALPGYRSIWLKAQFARKQERLTKLDLVSLVGMSVVGIAGLAGIMLWRFPKILGDMIETAGISSKSLGTLVSTGAPFAVIAGALIMVWLLTQDSFFAER